MNLELLVLLRIDQCSQNVGRKQIWSKLNSAEFSAHSLSKSIDCQCFSKSRDTFEENMAVCEKAYEQILDKLFLSHNDLAHFHRKKVNERALTLDALIEFFDINTFHYCIILNFITRLAAADLLSLCLQTIFPVSVQI